MITAHIRDNLTADALDIYLLDDTNGHRTLLRLTHPDPTSFDTTITREPLEPATELPHPSIRLSNDLARALLDALARHYVGASDVRQLRKDYDNERARVDRLIQFLAATTGAHQ